MTGESDAPIVNYSVPAFTDSIDAAGDTTTGICGEKEITFNVSPSYLTIVNGADPVLDNFEISFDETNAYESDIGEVTV